MKIKKEWMGLAGLIVVLIGLFVYKSQVSIGDTITLEPSSTEIKVYICGEIMEPGVYSLDPEDRLEQLINLAGGFTEEANVNGVNLARKLADGEKIVVYPQNKEVTYIGIDILNYGDMEALLAIDGIGEVIAERIIDYRQVNGFYSSFDDLLEVDGIGEQKLNAIIQELNDW